MSIGTYTTIKLSFLTGNEARVIPNHNGKLGADMADCNVVLPVQQESYVMGRLSVQLNRPQVLNAGYSAVVGSMIVDT